MDDFPGPDAFIEARILADRVPGLSVAVVADDRVVWLRGFGVADLSHATPAGPQTAYLWFSMTKIVTATAVMQLAEQGRLDLDAAVNEYFPTFAVVRQPTPISVRHLLSHSSGLANPIPLRWVHAADTPAPDPRAFVEHLLTRHRRLRWRPGHRAGYSNLGYLVLGEVITQVTGDSFEHYVRERVLTPLGMRHTGFSYDEIGANPAAVGYQPVPVPLTPVLHVVLPNGVVGPRHGRYVGYRPFYVIGRPYGGLIGGVDDVARLALAHLNHGTAEGVRLLSPASTAAMQRIVPRGGSRDFGLGWFRTHSDGGPGVRRAPRRR